MPIGSLAGSEQPRSLIKDRLGQAVDLLRFALADAGDVRRCPSQQAAASPGGHCEVLPPPEPWNIQGPFAECPLGGLLSGSCIRPG